MHHFVIDNREKGTYHAHPHRLPLSKAILPMLPKESTTLSARRRSPGSSSRRLACQAGSGVEKAFMKLAKSLGVEGFGNIAERTGRTDDGGKNHGEHC